MQNIDVQKDRRNKTPVLSGDNRLIIFCPIPDKHIGVLCIGKNVCQYSMKTISAGCQRYLIRSETPEAGGSNRNNPGKPGKAFELRQPAIRMHSGPVACSNPHGTSIFIVCKKSILHQSLINSAQFALLVPTIISQVVIRSMRLEVALHPYFSGPVNCTNATTI